MRHAMIVFTKVPKAGQVKTRLMIERGGIFTAEETKDFYEASLLDVIDHCITANCCDVYVCCNKDGDRGYLQQLLHSVPNGHLIKEVFPDEGGTFDLAMQYAADYILKNGEPERLADTIIIVGGDMPCLQPSIIKDAVRRLEGLAAGDKALVHSRNGKVKTNIGAAIIVSADQAGGFNIIGYTCTTPFDFNGVFYNPEGITALDKVVRKALSYSIPIGLVEMVPDIDIPEDLGGLIPVMNTLQLAEQHDASIQSPKRTLKLLQMMGLEASAGPN